MKHSAPTILAAVPAREWHLSPAGITRCATLAERLQAFAARSIATSVEPKAVETATLVGERLGLPVDRVEGLHEHDRSDTKLLGDDAFQEAVRSLFAHPNDLVFGRETAAAALHRFERAIDHLSAARAPDEDVVVVTHGTVISLFVAAHSGEDGLGLWRRLALPSLVVLGRRDLRLEKVEASIA